MGKNVYEAGKKKAEQEGQDMTLLDQMMEDMDLKALQTLDLKDNDIVVVQPKGLIPSDQLRRIRIAMQGTKHTLGIDVKFLVIPHDFELKILRPAEKQK